jgi:hypothetical protein
VPVYSPSTPNIEVGTIARFEDGAFKRRGHLDKILGGSDAFRAIVPLGPPSDPSAFWFRTEGSVTLEPTGTVEVLGQQLLRGRLAFSGKRAVVASFAGLREWAVDDPRSFDDLLWKLYVEGDLDTDEVVVWSYRRAASGTVLVNRSGQVDVEVSVDPALVSGLLSFEGLGVGVKFGAGSSASAQETGTNLAFVVQVKGLDHAHRQIVTTKGFQGSTSNVLDGLLGSDVPAMKASDVVRDVDFDAPEE